MRSIPVSAPSPAECVSACSSVFWISVSGSEDPSPASGINVPFGPSTSPTSSLPTTMVFSTPERACAATRGSRHNSADGEGDSADVKGIVADVKGNRADVKGIVADVKGIVADVKGK
eukprot:1176531-Prorocentrum_minimum.AAC.3